MSSALKIQNYINEYKFTYQYNLYLLCHHIPCKILGGDLNNNESVSPVACTKKIHMLNHWENYDTFQKD